MITSLTPKICRKFRYLWLVAHLLLKWLQTSNWFLVSAGHHEDVWEIITCFLISRTRTLNNIISPTTDFAYTLKQTRLVFLRHGFLSFQIGVTTPAISNDVLQTHLRNTEGWHFISMLQTDGNWKVSQWEATPAVSVHLQRVHLPWALGAELISSKRQRKYLESKCLT